MNEPRTQAGRRLLGWLAVIASGEMPPPLDTGRLAILAIEDEAAGGPADEGLRERSEAATPGPWFYDSYSRIYGQPPSGPPDDPEYPQVVPLPRPTGGDITTAQGVADAYLIVEAVNYIRAALAGGEVSE